MSHPESATPGLDLSAIAQRVRQLIASAGIDQAAFSESVGVPYSTARAYITGQRSPSPEFLVGVMRQYGISPAWVLTGEGPMKVGPHVEPPEGATPRADHLSTDFVVIPLLPIKASAGNGHVNEPEAAYVVNGLCFSREWLTSRRLSPRDLRVIIVRGASMDGVLSDGDRVLIDMADVSPRSGFVYVIRQGDELLVKYCQLLPGGLLRVSSANATYAPYDVDLVKNPDVQIVGRVVASMHEW